MGSSNWPDGYTIFDSTGITRVETDKDGTKKEYKITEDEWRKAHPEHRNSGCQDCKFVQDRETLFIYFIPREAKEKAGSNPEFVGNFTMPGWTGHAGFYIFKCQECGTVCADYPHGYDAYGCLYLKCTDQNCFASLILEPSEVRHIYERENVVAPPDREDLESELREVIDQVERRGIRVIMPGANASKKGLLRRIFNLKS